MWKFELWRHGDEKQNRDDAIDGLTKKFRRLISRAKKEVAQPLAQLACYDNRLPTHALLNCDR